MVPSFAAETYLVPSELTATAHTLSLCSPGIRISRPVSSSHTTPYCRRRSEISYLSAVVIPSSHSPCDRTGFARRCRLQAHEKDCGCSHGRSFQEVACARSTCRTALGCPHIRPSNWLATDPVRVRLRRRKASARTSSSSRLGHPPAGLRRSVRRKFAGALFDNSLKSNSHARALSANGLFRLISQRLRLFGETSTRQRGPSRSRARWSLAM